MAFSADRSGASSSETNVFTTGFAAALRIVSRRSVIDAAHKGKIWVGVCGELAGEIVLTPLLVGLGIDELSIGPFQVPLVKRAIRSLDLTTCEALAAEVLDMADPELIFARCADVAREHYPELL